MHENLHLCDMSAQRLSKCATISFSQVFWQKKRPQFPIFTQLLSQQVQQPHNATVSQGQPIMSHQASQQQQQGQQQQLQQQQVLQESA